MGGQTVCTHCFLSNLIVVISNTAVLWRLVIGREQTNCFLVELWSAEITVPPASSQPTSLCVFQLFFGRCNLRAKSGFGPMYVRWLASSQDGSWYFIAGAKIGFITSEHPTLRWKVVHLKGRTLKFWLGRFFSQMLCRNRYPLMSQTHFCRYKQSCYALCTCVCGSQSWGGWLLLFKYFGTAQATPWHTCR